MQDTNILITRADRVIEKDLKFSETPEGCQQCQADFGTQVCNALITRYDALLTM